MRDHTKLRAFELADGLVMAVYDVTRNFPRDEQFGSTSQLRRAAVSIASNIVEGSARSGLPEYIRFLGMAYSSAKEVEYQLSIARRLAYADQSEMQSLESKATETCKVLNGLLKSLRRRT